MARIKTLTLVAAMLSLSYWAATFAMVVDPPRPEAAYGIPSTELVAHRHGFTAGICGRIRSSAWTLEYLDASLVDGPADRVAFTTDNALPIEFRPVPDDYRESGFDRGHLAAAGNCRWSPDAMADCFRLSNMAPQTAALNRGPWRELEESIRRIAAKPGCRVWIVTGPLWMPDATLAELDQGKPTIVCVSYRVIGPNHVPVPTHFFKSVLVEVDGQPDVNSYVLPNRSIDLPDFRECRVSVDFVEHWAGLDLWASLPDELETKLEKGR